MIFLSLNDVINIVYHVENQLLTRYSGNYYQFQEVHAMKRAQLEAAYERQQKEIADLRDFVNRNKARVATPEYRHVPSEEIGQDGNH